MNLLRKLKIVYNKLELLMKKNQISSAKTSFRENSLQLIENLNQISMKALENLIRI